MDARQMYEKWLRDFAQDPDLVRELTAIAGDDKEIEDRFYRGLEFGTAGMRGVIGYGTNRMNAYNVRRATQGLANFIEKVEGGPQRGVAIAYDAVVSPVSNAVTNTGVASVIFTVEWDI